MSKQWIKNTDAIATSEDRKKVLQIAEAGFSAIDTEAVVASKVKLDGKNLHIDGHDFNLAEYEKVFVVGFGKASCKAAYALEQVLGKAIEAGIAIGLEQTACELIDTYIGTHPEPSEKNVEVSEKIANLGENITERDLVIVIVSGGGSSLLCWPLDECKQSQKLYEDFLPTGGSVLELNTIRKHISSMKGGGLAKILYPATVVGLVFSDVPGDHFNLIASGPTYLDQSTVADAQAILDKYNLSGFELKETPKEEKYFENVTNIPLVSNKQAVQAMAECAESLGMKTKILSYELYEDYTEVAKMFAEAIEPNTVVLGAGEPKLVVTSHGGSGGRNQMLAMEVLPKLAENEVFASIASDGLDNGKYAGIVEDLATWTNSQAQNLDYQDYKNRFDSEAFYAKIGNELLVTGPTEANVSDLMLYYKA